MKKIFTLLSFVALGISANAQTNLITNPDFESWDNSVTPAKPTGWTLVSATVSQESTIFKSGSSSVKTVAPSSGNTSTYIDINASENTAYTLGYWVLDNDANARGRVWVQARTTGSAANITWSTAGAFQPTTYSSDASAWTFVTGTATTPATTAVLRFDLRTYGTGSGGGTIYYDDVILVQGTSLKTIDIKEFDKKVKMNTLVSDNLTLIELPSKSTVNIYSVDGKLVSSNRVNSGESINVSKLQKGNYIVTVEDGTNKISRKIVKK